jgi:hypothetical protein
VQHFPAVRIGGALGAGLLAVLAGFVAVPEAAAATVVQPGQVRVLSDTGHPYPALPAPTGDNEVRGYGFAAKVTGDECATTVGSGPDELTAPAGDEVCAFSLGLSLFHPLLVTDNGQNIAALAGKVTDGTSTDPITLSQLDNSGDTEFAVSVPKNSDAVLSLSAAGFSQSFSLSEQTQVGSAPAVVYRSASSYEMLSYPATEATISETGVSDHKAATEKVTLSQLELTYFRPDDPLVRAPALSQAFLAVSFGTTDEPGPSGDAFGDFPPLPGSAVELRLPGPEVVKSLPVGDAALGLLADTYVFVVPAGFYRGSVLVEPGTEDGSETNSAGNYQRSEPVSFSDATIPINGGVAGANPSVTTTTTVRHAVTSTTTARTKRKPGVTTKTTATRATATTKARGATGKTVGPGATTAPAGATTAPAGPGRDAGASGHATTAPRSAKVPLAVPIGGGSTVLLIVILVPIWWRRKRARELVVFFPLPTTGNLSTASTQAPAAIDVPGPAELLAPGPEERQPEPTDPGEPEPEPAGGEDEAGLPVRLVGNVLGPVETRPDLGDSERRSLERLAVALMLSGGREVTSKDLCTMLATNKGAVKATTVANYVWHFRKRLGADVLVTNRRSATYRFVGEVELDWADFEDLERRARFADADERLELLQAALSLVRGQPFGGDELYGWASELIATMQGSIRRAAMEVSKTLAGEGRYEAAARAAGIGILADPLDFELHEQRLRCCDGDERAITEAWADTERCLGKRAAPLARLRTNLVGKIEFGRKERFAGS